MTYELVIVGGGNMGAALLGGLLTGGRDASRLAVCEVAEDRRARLRADFPAVDVREDVAPCVGAVIAVKPPDAAAATTAAVASGATQVLSIAAGVPISTLEAAAGRGVAVIRAMPNTPALVGEGASAISGGAGAAPADLDWAASILGTVGTVERVEEKQLDAVTALSGSGPAYLFLVAEALEDAGVAAGLTRPLATRLTAQLFVGSAALLAARGDAAGLRRMVTSPGGTTAAGLDVLDARGVRDAFVEAVAAAARRSVELGRS